MQDKTVFLKWEDFRDIFFQIPQLMMVWGDVGTGKTSLALQLANQKFLQNKKVFYLYTKKALINNIIERYYPQAKEPEKSLLYYWEANTFSQQQNIINSWLLQIQQLLQFFKENRVSLLIIDEIMSLYLIEFGKESQNEKLNQSLNFQLATLQKIIEDYKISIIILNSLSTKKDENDVSISQPHGGKIIDYWTDLDIRVERTTQNSRLKFICTKNKKKTTIPQSWTWLLDEFGFK